jgi:AraC-like DNA-binding protein
VVNSALSSIHQNSFPKILLDKRIELAKNNLTDDNYKNYTIEAIANVSGFKSRESFAKIFKSKTGISPSEFRNSNYLQKPEN